MKPVFFLFISLIIGSFANLIAQNPYIRHYTTSNGLPTNTIYQIYQDSHKFLWFTSEAGVVKFDGSTFISYRKKDGLSSNDVVRIKGDSKGRIWLFNYNGSVNYIQNNKIYNGKNAPFLNSLMGKGFLLDFFTDSNQTINFYNWQNEVFSLDTNNKISKVWFLKNVTVELPLIGKNYEKIKLLYLSKNTSGEWIFWTSSGVFKKHTLQSSELEVIDPGLFCQAVFPAGNNTYYVRTATNKLIKVSGNLKKEIIPYPGDLLKIQTIIEDSKGYLWIAAYDEGVYCIKNKKVARHFDFKDALGLFQDHEQNIWVSTQTDGIFMINHDLLEQDHFDDTSFDNQGLNELCDYPGMGIWCTNTKSAFLLKNRIFYKLSVPKAILPVNIAYMFKDQTLVLGTVSNRLCTYAEITLNTESREIDYRKKRIHNITIKKIINDKSGDLTAVYDQSRIQFITSAKPLLNSEFKQIGERVNNAYFNSKNELIINSGRNFLYKNNKLQLYPELKRFDGSIISDHLVLDDSTELFNIDGDSLYILKNNKFYNLTDAFDSHVDKQINKIIYEESTLYFATLRDIFVCHNPIKVTSGKPVHIEPLNLSFNNINDILIHEDTLYIASDDGLTVIAETSVDNNVALPPIPYLKTITVNDKVNTLPDRELKLTGKNNIKLSFGCISYSSSPVIYSYKLEGAENKWTIGSGNGINLVYQNLPKGRYVFKLRVRKSNSVWSNPLELIITIKPTLVEYPAFWAFVVIMAAGLIFLIIFLIRIQKTKRVELDHQLIVMEQKALQSMMNPHFIFNSLGSIQNYLLKNKGSEAVIYLSQFARLIRQNLNAINTPMIFLEEEVDRLRNYIDLEKKRLENKFDYSIEIEKKLEEEGVYIPSMLIQPIVENSIWHGMALLEGKGVIKIRIQTYNSKSVQITIEDNGIGMKKALEYASKSSQHQHLGMQIIKKRLDLLSKKYKTETSINYSEYSPDNDTKGTVVVIIMPLIYSIEDF